MTPNQTHIIYHLVRAVYWNHLNSDVPYLPQNFDSDGFIHCTKGLEKLLQVANTFYRDVAGEFLLLAIDERRVFAPVKYEGGFPHIYGPLNRDAIFAIQPIKRRDDGRFESPANAD
ncbi:MAG TPA: DUF952 domain-containing protein [Chloroflexi bacterium]|nr:DUF952 domain-containing protein [Chloroflexota bacterium]